MVENAEPHRLDGLSNAPATRGFQARGFDYLSPGASLSIRSLPKLVVTAWKFVVAWQVLQGMCGISPRAAASQEVIYIRQDSQHRRDRKRAAPKVRALSARGGGGFGG